MDRNEKKRLRERIGEDLDISGTRLTDAEAEQLGNFVENYDEYRGKSTTFEKRREGWSSDGKYTRDETVTETFTERPGIRREYSYQDDDGQSGDSTSLISDARGVLNWLKGRR